VPLAIGALLAAGGVLLLLPTEDSVAPPQVVRGPPRASAPMGFDQLNVTRRSRLDLDPVQRRDGRPALRARVLADAAAGNTFARGVRRVDWRAGDAVVYGMDVRLPRGFLAGVQGEVDLVRWDDYGRGDGAETTGGVALFAGDRRLHLVHSRGDATTDDLLGPFELTEGVWHRVLVRQRLGTEDASSELWLDGRRLGITDRPNASSFPIDRVRFGLVAIGAGAQTRPLGLWFARPFAGIDAG
ncbi:hypothetical protein ACVU7I_13335, partial [Patulibacter sp. S7RM1-6]